MDIKAQQAANLNCHEPVVDHTPYQRSNLSFLHSWHADSHILALHLLIKQWRLWGVQRDVWTARLISFIWKRPIAATGLLKAKDCTFVTGWRVCNEEMSLEEPQITINLGRKKTHWDWEMTHYTLIHHIVNVPANIWATILDSGFQLMNVSHAQLCNRNGKSINYRRSVSSTKAPLSPWPGSSSDGLTHILPCSLPWGSVLHINAPPQPPSGPSSTNQPTSSLLLWSQRPAQSCVSSQ